MSDVDSILARVYSTLVEACTKPPDVAGLPPPSGSAAADVVMQYPGQPVHPPDVVNPWTPAADGSSGGSGNPGAREHLSRMVDLAPQMSPYFADGGVTVEEFYELVVNATVANDTLVPLSNPP